MPSLINPDAFMNINDVYIRDNKALLERYCDFDETGGFLSSMNLEFASPEEIYAYSNDNFSIVSFTKINDLGVVNDRKLASIPEHAYFHRRYLKKLGYETEIMEIVEFSIGDDGDIRVGDMLTSACYLEDGIWKCMMVNPSDRDGIIEIGPELSSLTGVIRDKHDAHIFGQASTYPLVITFPINVITFTTREEVAESILHEIEKILEV